ncbi:MAG: histidine kinase, partial [Chitinophagaceae bacterium]
SPHFIFNCLNSIDNLIQTDEKDMATNYLAKFAKLIRAILENSKQNVIPCWKDLESLRLYLELEEFRYNNKFSYHIKIADEILEGDYKVPPLIIQPFVENAIHHGLLNKQFGARDLWIDVSVDDDNTIKYTITDNGVGRAQANIYNQINGDTHFSMGMEVTIDRISLFNKGDHGGVKVTDLKDENNDAAGTQIEVWLLN